VPAARVAGQVLAGEVVREVAPVRAPGAEVPEVAAGRAVVAARVEAVVRVAVAPVEVARAEAGAAEAREEAVVTAVAVQVGVVAPAVVPATM
jgi:hypothetical protein